MKPEKNLSRTAVNLFVCGRPLTVLTVAVILLTALFWSGCASHRKSERTAREGQTLETVRTDSVVRLASEGVSELAEVRTEAVTVPKSAVSLTIATDSLRRLPAGASYSERSGQASVKVGRVAATATEPESIYVYATCDSLLVQCERYERTIRTLQRNYGEQLRGMETRANEAIQEVEELKANAPDVIGTAVKWYFVGLLSGIIGTIIIFMELKKLKK